MPVMDELKRAEVDDFKQKLKAKSEETKNKVKQEKGVLQ